MQVHQYNINLLRVYLYFRTALALLLVSMFLVPGSSNIVGTLHPSLYLWTCLTYTSICMVTFFVAPAERLNRSFNLLLISLFIDIISVLILLHTSGGVDSGLGYLILIFVAISAIFIRGQLATGFAAMTSLLVIAESLYLAATYDVSNQLLFSAGILGILIFCTAFAFQYFSETLRVSNQKALEQAKYAEHLQRLAQIIIKRMRTGIIVVDEHYKIELINESALQLLDLTQDETNDLNTLDDLSTLKPFLIDWQTRESTHSVVEEIRPGYQARVGFARIDTGSIYRTVIYLEDHRALTQQAQQLKLASLGRLTASIAHEVRNPLGAISHAAQLLAESPNIDPVDKRLTEIIDQHSHRVNGIIESTLALSRRKEANPQTLDLLEWTPQFLSQYTASHDAKIHHNQSEQNHLIKMDPTHLSQVLTNLLDNGLRYSHKATKKTEVILNINQSTSDDTSYLEVIDFGEGISDNDIAHIFDPFYTTDEQGSGLGLYISKELCEINQASLHYGRTPEGLSCFRIDFSHHQRMF